MNMFVSTEEFSGSDYLEFRKGNSGAGRKFLRQDSLYVLDSAFSSFWKEYSEKSLHPLICLKILVLQEKRVAEIMHLNIPEIVPSEFVNEAMETLSAMTVGLQKKSERTCLFTMVPQAKHSQIC